MTFVLDTPDQIQAWYLLSMRSRLKLEISGLKFKDGSTYAHIKRTYGYKGSRESVLEQFEKDLRECGVLREPQ
jgi:hypothetical protein